MCQQHGFSSGQKHGCFPFVGGDVSKIMRMGEKFMRHFMGRCGSQIPYNLEDLDNEYLITIPLPGRDKEDVKVSLIGRTLNITAKKPKTDEKSDDDVAKERTGHYSWSHFKFIDVNMDIPLPVNADENVIKSVMSKGLLRIKIGKNPSKTININDEGNN